MRTRVYRSGQIGWQVDYGRVGGRRKQVAFDTEEDAQAALNAARKARRKHGHLGVSMSAHELADAMLALEKLYGHNASLLTAAEHYVKHGALVKERVTMAELVKRFLYAKWDEQKSLRYRQQLKVSLGQFSRDLALKKADEVTREDVNAWLRGHAWSPKTRNNYLGDARSLFVWAIREKLAATNPCTGIVPARETQQEIGTLTLGECRRLLDVAWGKRDDPARGKLLAYVVLGLFCGIRRAEIERLTWDAIDMKSKAGTVIVAAASAKTRKRRVVDLSAAAKAWLKLCPRAPAGKITPNKFSEKWREFRLGHGFKTWPNNALRHTFASYHYAMHQNDALLQAQMGSSSSMLHKHYRALKTKTEARKFWKLRPGKRA